MTEKPKRTENWIDFTTPENESKIGSPTFIRQLLGIDILDQQLRNEIADLKWHVEFLEEPTRKAKILSLLKEGGHHTFEWFQKRSSPTIKLGDLESLVAENILIRTEQPHNHRKLYSLKPEGSP